MTDRDTILKNFVALERRVREAEAKAGRAPHSVHLVAVTKNRSIEEMRILRDIGVKDFGENRVQEALHKKSNIASDIVWHLIGSVQRKKAPHVVGEFDYIHSIDSLSLAEALSTSAKRPLSVLIQVNPLGETTKHGISPAEMHPFFEKVMHLPNLKVCGLMAMAPRRNTLFSGDVESAFEKTQECFLSLKDTYPSPDFQELSMGMSQDFEEAIAFGATCIRIGSLLFEDLPIN